jgi:TolB protein
MIISHETRETYKNHGKMARKLEKTIRVFFCVSWKKVGLLLGKAQLVALGLFLINSAALAQADVYLKLSTSERQPLELAVAGLRSKGRAVKSPSGPASQLMEILKDDLEFSLHFRVIEQPEGDQEYGFKNGKVEARAWQLLGAKMVLIPELFQAKRADSLRVRIYDLGVERDVLTAMVPSADNRGIAHGLCDRIVRTLTGEKGVATTRIAYCLKDGQNKEICACDYDGHNRSRLTNFKSLNLSPNWSPDGTKLAFLSYVRHRTEIFELGLGDMAAKAVSQAEGLNTSPAYSPDGRSLALTLSRDGNAEIYIMDLGSKGLKRLTSSWAIDCSPSWSPNGRELAFNSDRPGSPQIYLMDSDGSNLRRLTFQGGYNTSPAWSPRGDRVAYVSRINGRFQVCTIGVTGEGFAQLTFEGDNEDPSWSPDGLHLVFSSNRGGSQQLWQMHYDGSGQRAVTFGSEATMPAWGPAGK